VGTGWQVTRRRIGAASPRRQRFANSSSVGFRRVPSIEVGRLLPYGWRSGGFLQSWPGVPSGQAAIFARLATLMGRKAPRKHDFGEVPPRVKLNTLKSIPKNLASIMTPLDAKTRKPQRLPGFLVILRMFGCPKKWLWWAVRDSNPRHPACKAGALTS
jgi:hypothetical protein